MILSRPLKHYIGIDENEELICVSVEIHKPICIKK